MSGGGGPGTGRADRGPVVAIDGPAGAGKSTLAKGVAVAVGLPYVNTGLMYRAVAARALASGIDPADSTALAEVARGMRFAVGRGDPPELLIDGLEAPASLRAPEVEAVVSSIAKHPEVRRVLRESQRRTAPDGAVVEGRDIGSVVFPEAEVKLFVTADAVERGRRRARERGAAAASASHHEALAARDRRDDRTTPLLPAPGAVTIDTTNITAEQALAKALEVVREGLRRGEARG